MIYSAPRKGHKDWITLKASLNTKTNGYHTVKLSIKGKSHTKYVHDLVGKAFNQCDADPKKEWRHYPDPDKSNNRADNLVWGTRRENIWDRIEANGRTEDWNIFPTTEQEKSLDGSYDYSRQRTETLWDVLIKGTSPDQERHALLGILCSVSLLLIH